MTTTSEDFGIVTLVVSKSQEKTNVTFRLTEDETEVLAKYEFNPAIALEVDAARRWSLDKLRELLAIHG